MGAAVIVVKEVRVVRMRCWSSLPAVVTEVLVCLRRPRQKQPKDSSSFVVRPQRCRQFGHVDCDDSDATWLGQNQMGMALGGDKKR